MSSDQQAKSRLDYALLLFPGCHFLLQLQAFQSTYGYLTASQNERVEENIRRSIERRRRAGVEVPEYAGDVRDEDLAAQYQPDLDDEIPF